MHFWGEVFNQLWSEGPEPRRRIRRTASRPNSATRVTRVRENRTPRNLAYDD